jgi:hypothetical protein
MKIRIFPFLIACVSFAGLIQAEDATAIPVRG